MRKHDRSGAQRHANNQCARGASARITRGLGSPGCRHSASPAPARQRQDMGKRTARAGAP
jgi:hypothetical protein